MAKKSKIADILDALLDGDILLTILCSGCFYAAFFRGFLKLYPRIEAVIYLSGIIVLMISLLLLVSFVVCCFAKIKVSKIILAVALLAPIIVFIEMLFMTFTHV